MPKQKIEFSEETLQLIDALKNTDVPAARALLDKHPALSSTPIPSRSYIEHNQYPIHLTQSNEMIELLVSHGADVNAGDASNRTPLHGAHYLDTVRLLISLGANVNGLPASDCAPIHSYAAYPEILEFLISQGANVNARSVDGATPLHEAADYDQNDWEDWCASEEAAEKYIPEIKSRLLRCAKMLIEHGIDIGAEDNYGQTALHIAAKAGFAEMVELLLDSGADVNALDSDRETPLHHAAQRLGQREAIQLAQRGRREAVELLLAHGSNVNARSKAGWYPLEMAMMHGNGDVADLLRQSGARPPKAAAQLFQAVYNKEAEQVIELVSRRPNLVNVRNSLQQTPLNVALQTDFEEGAKLLLDAGADPNSKDDCPLMFAVHQGNLAIAKMLIDAGADVDIDSRHRNNGFTPLTMALRLQDTAMAKLLIESGAAVNISSHRRRDKTPLHLAAYLADLEAYLEIVRALVERGADVNAAGPFGWAPIGPAASKGEMSVIQFLLESGADVNAGTRGRVLVAAVNSGNIDVLRFLLDAGADVKGAGLHGVSALHEAAMQGRIDMIDMLLDAGARINSRTKKACSRKITTSVPKGTTPLGLALIAGQEEAADRLRERGGHE